MGKPKQNHRVLYTTGEVPKSVEKLCLSLETLLKSKQQKLSELFSQDELDAILKITLELYREEFNPDWSLYLSTLGAELPITGVRIELFPIKDVVKVEFLKLAAQKGLELLAQAKEHELKTGSK